MQTNSLTYQAGQDIVVRAQFINNGVLANTEDTNFRAVSDDWPVFALAHDLGTVAASEASPTVVYALGHVRDPAIQYIIADNGRQDRSLYFWSQYASVADIVRSPCCALLLRDMCIEMRRSCRRSWVTMTTR